MTKQAETQTTPGGVEYTNVGGRVIVPTPDHKLGGGVAISADMAEEIRHSVNMGDERGEVEVGQIEWEFLGTTSAADGLSHPSKDYRITQTSFGRERTIELTMVDLFELTYAAEEGA